MPVYVGQAAIDAVVAEGELLVVDSQQVQNRGIEIINMDRIFQNV